MSANSPKTQVLESASEMGQALQGFSQKWFRFEGGKICQSEIYSIERYLQSGVFALTVDKLNNQAYLAHPSVGVCDATDRILIKFNSNGRLYEEMKGFSAKELGLARCALNSALNHHLAKSAKPTPRTPNPAPKEHCAI